MASFTTMGGMVVAIACFAGSPTLLGAQTFHRWNYRVQLGRTEIHRSTSTDAIITFALSREIGLRGMVRAAGELGTSGADEGFFTLVGGLEFRPLPDGQFTPFGKLCAGLLGEPEYGGSVYAATAGLLFRVGNRTRVLGAISRGTHGGTHGPHSFFVGLERGFGTPRSR